jgi:HEPN domain-containing protein
VKSTLALLEIPFPKTHDWTEKQFDDLAQQIQTTGVQTKLEKHFATIFVPRLLLLASFWAKFYLTAKYGFEAANLAPPEKLFKKCDADLAIEHAEECHRAATQLRYLQPEKLAAILHP